MAPLPDPAQTPGFACPQCDAKVEVSLDALLLGLPIRCPGCATEFRMDRAKSQKAVEVMQRAHAAAQAVQAARTPGTGG